MSVAPAHAYLLSRAGWYLATFFVAVTLTFFLPRLGPVDPVDIILSNINTAGMDATAIAAMEQEYRRAFDLDKPLIVQYLRYLWRSARLDLGTSSISYPRSCIDIIAAALPWSLALVVPTVLLSWVVGNALGALAAYRRGIFDRVLYPISLFLSAVPFFCFGLILVFVFYTVLGSVDSLGAYSPGAMPGFTLAFAADVMAHYWLPFLSIFAIMTGGQAIGMRSMCIYELGTDYVRYAKGLGIAEYRVLLYVFRNAMLPQLTGLALALGTMIGGTLITEIIFSYPGLGLLMLRAINTSDFPLIQSIALLITTTVLLLNFGVDVLIGVLDPRISTAPAHRREQ